MGCRKSTGTTIKPPVRPPVEPGEDFGFKNYCDRLPLLMEDLKQRFDNCPANYTTQDFMRLLEFMSLIGKQMCYNQEVLEGLLRDIFIRIREIERQLIEIWKILDECCGDTERPAIIYYEVRGGTPISPVSVALGDTHTVLSTTKSGAKLIGWTANPNATLPEYQPGDPLLVQSNIITLYAIWEDQYYRVIYHVEGGSPMTPDTINVPIGTSHSVLSPPNRTGYTFLGWSLVQGSGTVNYRPSPGSPSVIPSPVSEIDINLYAVWDLITRQLAYNPNGGTGTPVIINVTHISNPNFDVTLLSNVDLGFDFTNRIFNGWNTAANGSGTHYPAGSVFRVNTSTTLYAQWSMMKYTVTYAPGTMGANAQGMPNPLDYSHDFGVAHPLQAFPTSTTHRCTGWQSSGVGGTLGQTGSFMFNQDVTLTAQWSTLYSVTYDINGGTGTTPVDSNRYIQNDSVTLLQYS